MIHNDTPQMRQSEMYESETPYSSRFATLGMLAIVAQLFLLATVWLLPTVSEFSAVGDNISELVLGDFGVIQTIAFLFAGITTLALAYPIRQLTKGARGSLVGSLLVAINGAGLLLVALFPTDRIDTPAAVWTQSTTGTIHLAISLICFICIIVAMLVLTWTFAHAPQWRSIALGSGIFASAALALFFVQSEGPWVGLMQRLLVLMIAAWTILVAWRVRWLVRSDKLAA